MKKSKAKSVLKGKARMRTEIVEAMRGLNRIGAVGDAELEKTTLRMLGCDALPKVADLSPSEIVAVRERAGVSQAVLAGFLNVAANTSASGSAASASRPGAALKLLHVVKRSGIEALR